MSQCSQDTVGPLLLFSHSTSQNQTNTQLEAVGLLESLISNQATAVLLGVYLQLNFKIFSIPSALFLCFLSAVSSS